MSSTNSEILNKNQLSSKLVKYLLFYTKGLTPPPFSKEISALHGRGFNKHWLLTTF